MSILVVGAGFAGATIGRTLAEAGFQVDIFDQRSHLGGNAHDFVNPLGERIHRYGPHLLHGNRHSAAVSFLSRFTDWTPYEHRVRALLPDGTTTPLPVNRTTLEEIFKIELSDDGAARSFLDSIRKTALQPGNCDELFLSSVGERVADLLFRPYTRKMWGLDAKELELAIGARLPVRTNRDERYFTDSFQALPSAGYTQMFERMLDHAHIRLRLNCPFERGVERHYDHCFLCIPIDHYFGHAFGPLPYRSIRFHHIESRKSQAAPVINRTDTSPYTRTTQWSLLANSGQPANGIHTLTQEEPCSLDDNPGEYYYPIQTAQSRQLYGRYSQQASQLENVTFCGRTGLFRYIDMIPAVTLHLELTNRFLKGLDFSSL